VPILKQHPATAREVKALLLKRNEKQRLRLAGERKICRCHIGCFVGCRKGFLDTNKKTNYIARLKTARRIY
jgi:hypothetical protein